MGEGRRWEKKGALPLPLSSKQTFGVPYTYTYLVLTFPSSSALNTIHLNPFASEMI